MPITYRNFLTGELIVQRASEKPSKSGPKPRKPLPKATKPMNKQSPAKRADNAVWAKVTREAFKLAGGLCQVCKVYPAEHGHHKKSRAQRGKSVLENCLPCCHDCHRKLHDRPTAAAVDGFSVSRKADAEKE